MKAWETNDIEVHIEEDHYDNEEILPLQNIPPPDAGDRNPTQEAISQAFQSTAHLANLLPIGTVMAFHLAPIFTNEGNCDNASRLMTSILIFTCAIVSFTLRFSEGQGWQCLLRQHQGPVVIDESVEIPTRAGWKILSPIHRFSACFHASTCFYSHNITWQEYCAMLLSNANKGGPGDS